MRNKSHWSYSERNCRCSTDRAFFGTSLSALAEPLREFIFSAILPNTSNVLIDRHSLRLTQWNAARHQIDQRILIPTAHRFGRTKKNVTHSMFFVMFDMAIRRGFSSVRQSIGTIPHRWIGARCRNLAIIVGYLDLVHIGINGEVFPTGSQAEHVDQIGCLPFTRLVLGRIDINQFVQPAVVENE